MIGSSDRVISLGEYDADCKKHAEKQRIFLIVQNGFAKILFQISTKHQNMKIPLFIDIFQLLSLTDYLDSLYLLKIYMYPYLFPLFLFILISYIQKAVTKNFALTLIYA